MSAGGVNIGAGFLTIDLKFPDLGRASAGVGTAVGKAIQGAGAGLGKALQGSAPAIRGLGTALESAFRGAGRGFGDTLKGSAPAIKGTGAALEKAFSGAGRGLGQTTAGVGKGLGQASAGFGTGLNRAITGTAAPIRAVGASLGQASAGFGTGLGRSLQGLSSTINAALSPLRMLSGGGGLLRGLSGGGAGGAFGALAYGAGEAMNMETAMLRLGRATGYEGARLDALGGKLKGMASTMAGVSIGDVFGLATFGAKLGISGDRLEMFTRDLVRMSAVLEDIPAEEAATGIARLLNVFQRGPSDALRLASALNALDIQSTASARDILNMTTRMSGTAAVMKNMTIPQTMALATAMREAGIEVGVGGTAMSQFLMKMQGSQMGQFAQVAGRTREQFRAMVHDNPFQAFQSFAKGLSVKSTEDQIKTLEHMHFTGQRTGATLLQLTQLLGKLNEYADTAAREWSSMASITDGFNRVSGSTVAQLKLMWNNIGLLMARIGDGLLPIIKGFSSGLGALTADLSDYFEKSKGTIISWGQSIGDAMSSIGVAFRAFPLFVSYSVEMAKEKWAQLSEMFDRSKTLMGNSLKALGGYLGELMEQMGKNIGQNLVNGIIDSITDMASGPLGNLLNSIAPKIGAQFQGAVAGLKMAKQAPTTISARAEDHFKPEAIWKGLPDGLTGNLPQNPFLAGAGKAIQDARAKQVADGKERAAKQDKADAAVRQADQAKQDATDAQRRGAQPRVGAGRGPRMFPATPSGQAAMENAMAGFQRNALQAEMLGPQAMALAAQRRRVRAQGGRAGILRRKGMFNLPDDKPREFTPEEDARHRAAVKQGAAGADAKGVRQAGAFDAVAGRLNDQAIQREIREKNLRAQFMGGKGVAVPQNLRLNAEQQRRVDRARAERAEEAERMKARIDARKGRLKPPEQAQFQPPTMPRGNQPGDQAAVPVASKALQEGQLKELQAIQLAVAEVTKAINKLNLGFV